MDITDTSDIIEGETLDIYISRNFLLQSAMDETISNYGEGQDFTLTLNVTFYDESAVDLGGPRREFLLLVMKEFLNEDKNLLVEKDDGYELTNHEHLVIKRFYFGIGLLCGTFKNVTCNGAWAVLC